MSHKDLQSIDNIKWNPLFPYDLSSGWKKSSINVKNYGRMIHSSKVRFRFAHCQVSGVKLPFNDYVVISGQPISKKTILIVDNEVLEQRPHLQWPIMPVIYVKKSNPPKEQVESRMLLCGHQKLAAGVDVVAGCK